jgi:hypothetical protein
MTSSHLKHVFQLVRFNDMNDSASILLLVETFEYQIGSAGSFVSHQMIVYSVGFDHKGVSILADLTLKSLPENTGVVLT